MAEAGGCTGAAVTPRCGAVSSHPVNSPSSGPCLPLLSGGRRDSTVLWLCCSLLLQVMSVSSSLRRTKLLPVQTPGEKNPLDSKVHPNTQPAQRLLQGCKWDCFRSVSPSQSLPSLETPSQPAHPLRQHRALL